MAFAEEGLVSKSDLEEKDTFLSDLQSMLAEKTTEYEMNSLALKKQFEADAKRKQQEFADSIERENKRYLDLNEEMKRMQHEHQIELENLKQKFEKELQVFSCGIPIPLYLSMEITEYRSSCFLLFSADTR